MRGGDLAAAEFRSWLFGEQGFAIWNNAWFGGHHVPAYSVLFPPLGWLMGPRLVGVVAVIASAALFEALSRRQFGPGARYGALWFGAWAPLSLYADARIPFALGVAIGLLALLSLQRGHTLVAAGVAIACALASPVAALFLALAGVAIAIADSRWHGFLVAAASVVPVLVLTALFPEGGSQPWAFSSFIAVVLVVPAGLWLIPNEQRGLRIAGLAYLIVAVVAYAIPNPVGSNASRLGMLFAAPVLACVLIRVGPPHVGRRRMLVVVLLLATTWWGLSPAVRATVQTLGDAAGQAAYYTPLLEELDRLDPEGRIEIPFTRARRETDIVARRYPLARGWERQLDTLRNPIFYEGPLDANTYREWLEINAVEYVAVPDARLDYSSEAERSLVEGGLLYLDRAWTSDHWTLYRVPGSQAVSATTSRWSPYWYADYACVEEDENGFNRISRATRNPVTLEIRFDPLRLLSDGPRCGPNAGV